MFIYGRTQPLKDLAISDALGTLRGLGFEGVELCFENPDIDPRSALDEGLAARLRERLDGLGFPGGHSLSYHQDYVGDPDAFKGLIRIMGLSGALGSDVLVISCPYARTGSADEWDATAGRLRELCAAAEGNGLRLALEPEPRFVVGDTASLLRMMGEVGSAALHANLDLGHMFLGDDDPLARIRQVGPKVAHVHVENMRAGIHDHRLPHDGDMDLGEYVRALSDIGFKGGMALDMYKHDYREIAPDAIRYIKGLIAKAAL
ncbi:MAG: sugar phosphate isomerase/epimerase [Oscillospiraceae bacterium]|nr:sugar phosphate isomerase/epimerase [Oscillospiraceae bacterium]